MGICEKCGKIGKTILESNANGLNDEELCYECAVKSSVHKTAIPPNVCDGCGEEFDSPETVKIHKILRCGVRG